MASARAAKSFSGTFKSANSAAFPKATWRPSITPVTPLPVTATKSAAFSNASLRAAAPSTMAAASGCSLPCSKLAAKVTSAFSSKPSAASTVTSLGLPSVSVPVLSTTKVSTLRSSSMASAFLKSTPALAALPVATMMDIGVARPSAQGQAMMSTATALTTACAIRGSGPTHAQTAKVNKAMAMTAGTK